MTVCSTSLTACKHLVRYISQAFSGSSSSCPSAFLTGNVHCDSQAVHLKEDQTHKNTGMAKNTERVGDRDREEDKMKWRFNLLVLQHL